MSVRINLSVGDDLDKWISEKSDSLGIAKNAFVIMCVANARNQEENLKMMNNAEMFRVMEKVADSMEKDELKEG